MKMQTLAAAVLSGLLFGVPLVASAHTHLENSEPADKAALSAPPKTVQLRFSEKVAAEWSKIVVTDAAGKRVDKEKVSEDAADPKHIQVELDTLAPGSYKVDWNVISSDGHRVKGHFSFTVQ